MASSLLFQGNVTCSDKHNMLPAYLPTGQAHHQACSKQSGWSSFAQLLCVMGSCPWQAVKQVGFGPTTLRWAHPQQHLYNYGLVYMSTGPIPTAADKPHKLYMKHTFESSVHVLQNASRTLQENDIFLHFV